MLLFNSSSTGAADQLTSSAVSCWGRSADTLPGPVVTDWQGSWRPEDRGEGAAETVCVSPGVRRQVQGCCHSRNSMSPVSCKRSWFFRMGCRARGRLPGLWSLTGKPGVLESVVSLRGVTCPSFTKDKPESQRGHVASQRFRCLCVSSHSWSCE